MLLQNQPDQTNMLNTGIYDLKMALNEGTSVMKKTLPIRFIRAGKQINFQQSRLEGE